MTFDARESSRDEGAPITLYQFQYSATGFHRYTDADATVAFGGNDYGPIPISRGNIAASGTLDKTIIEVRTPFDSEISDRFLIAPPSQQVGLIIRQGHVGEAEFVVAWSGRVLACTREANEAVLACEPFSTALRRPGLRRHYQFGCPHVLYGTQCTANKAAATRAATVQAVGTTTVTLAPGWEGAFTPAKFIGGQVEWSGEGGALEIRTILRRSGDVLTLAGLVRDLASLDSISVILGCNHQESDCQDLHANINSFGGQPWIPRLNPHSSVNLFY